MDKRKKAMVIISAILGLGGLLYLGGILGQVLANYQAWLGGNGISGEEVMKPPDWNLLVCFYYAFTVNGLKGMVTAVLLGAAVVLYIRFHDKFQTQDGETEIVEDVQIENLDEAVKVYNLEIEDSHTYYVSADEMLVHNECNVTGGKNLKEHYVKHKDLLTEVTEKNIPNIKKAINARNFLRTLEI